MTPIAVARAKGYNADIVRLLAQLMFQYSVRCKQELKLTAKKVRIICDRLKTVVAVHGVSEVLLGIDVIFGKEFNWVDDKISAVTDPDFFALKIVPVVRKNKLKVAGEQAEWIEKRESAGSREVGF